MNLDYLSRQPFIDLLKSIITNQRGNPSGYSFAIDGDWGCGKTWILNELENQLSEENENYLIFHYNAWENDFYDEPLVALLSVMIEKLNEITSQKSLYEATVNELLSQVSADLLTLVSGIVKATAKIDIEKAIKRKKGFFKRIKQGTKISAREIDTLVPLKNTINSVRENLLKLSEKFFIILVVDELDRCLPEYAIKVLERLHHICNEIPIIQILAINKRHLADSIAKVFGKDYAKADNPTEWKKQFAESYLQKFLDVIIPLPNGKVDGCLEVLNGLENDFVPYIRDNFGQEFIKLDDAFLADFISSLMDGVDRRLQEKIFKQVALCHKLTLASGVKYKDEQMTYAILIYEIVSCIQKYVFHSKNTCEIKHTVSSNYILEFFDSNKSILDSYEYENSKLNFNLKSVFEISIPLNGRPIGNGSKNFMIYDTKSYVMAYFFPKPNYSYVTFESHIWDWISEDKIFLQKYDEIMDMLLAK